jgi:translation initiation factor IF-2
MAERQEQLAQPKMTLDRMFGQLAEKELQEILVVLKADVQGSVDVLKHEIEKVSGDEVKVRVLHSAVGGITESDVILAEASRAVIVGFNVIPSGKARSAAEQKGVQIRPYSVIYDIVDDMKKAAEGMLAPELKEEVLGHAEVRQVFKVSKVGTIAGCMVTDGIVQRDALIRVTRNDIVIENDRSARAAQALQGRRQGGPRQHGVRHEDRRLRRHQGGRHPRVLQAGRGEADAVIGRPAVATGA